MTCHRLLIISIITTLSVASSSCATAAPKVKHRSGRYSLEVLVDGKRLHTYRHRGQSYILGNLGRRYTLRVRNRTARRVEAVITVDGRDVLDGKRGHFRKRGYLVPAWGTVEIDGWRLSSASVAAFRFSTVSNSYAAKTGSARNVGVIGVAIFPERRRRPVYVPPPYLHDDDYDHRYRDGELGRLGSRSEAQGAPAPGRKGSRAAEKSSDLALGGTEERATAESSRSPSRSKSLRRKQRRRPGLATAFGERRHSPVQEVSFKRRNAKRPSAILGVRYNNRRGLLAMGVDLTRWHGQRREASLRRGASPFPADHGHYAAPPPGWRD